MTFNLKLKKGEIIDIISPSSANFKVSMADVATFVSEQLGYEARIREGIMVKGRDPFSANTDEVRLEQLLDALRAPDSQAIWAYRGGYGATRLIILLSQHDFADIPPKVIIGFSDLTALQLYFYQKYGWPYLHARGLGQFVDGTKLQDDDIDSIKNVLSGEWEEIKYALTPANDLARAEGTIEAEVIGGNLCLIECSLATDWQIKPAGKILFFEEVGEKGYRIHRMLEHLKQAGIFDNIRALIIGDIKCQAEVDGAVLCEDALSDFIGKADFPIFRSSDFGHSERNYPLLCGVKATLEMGENPTLVFENL